MEMSLSETLSVEALSTANKLNEDVCAQARMCLYVHVYMHYMHLYAWVPMCRYSGMHACAHVHVHTGTHRGVGKGSGGLEGHGRACS